MTTPSSLSLKKIYSGKVRDLYEIDAKRMLMVATDRLSAFDVILAEPIPEKGKILTAISNFWFDKLADLVPNHFTGDKVEDVVPAAELPLVENRALPGYLRFYVKDPAGNQLEFLEPDNDPQEISP